jgi:hypothetical protein
MFYTLISYLALLKSNYPAACCLFQRLVFQKCPPLTTRRFNTFIQVNIMGARYDIYNRHVHNLQVFFLCLLLTSGLAGWPQTFMSVTLPTS